MSFQVEQPGFLSLLQDAGRTGHRHLGMATGGPVDEHAFRWANRLLGNPPGAAAIEVTLGKLRLRAGVRTQFSLAGADMSATAGGRAAPPWRVHEIDAGELLCIETPRAGLRAYLAVPGGFRVAPRFGSCSTVVRERLGGLHGDGRPLAAGDALPFEPRTGLPARTVAPEFVPDYAAPLELRVVPGYQHRQFAPDELSRFFGSGFTVSQDSDRMGYRMQGPPVRCRLDGVLSEGISLGAVQVPADGQPIVLLADRQTLGGYPKLGCVTSLDCSRLAQRAPGAQVRFRMATLEEIVRERAQFEAFFSVQA